MFLILILINKNNFFFVYTQSHQVFMYLIHATRNKFAFLTKFLKLLETQKK